MSSLLLNGTYGSLAQKMHLKYTRCCQGELAATWRLGNFLWGMQLSGFARRN